MVVAPHSPGTASLPPLPEGSGPRFHSAGSEDWTAAEVYSYDYDRSGNRWHQNGPHSMMLSFSGNNNRMDDYSYDAAGNLRNDGTIAYTYDAENHIITASNAISRALSYVYDARGQRVRKTTIAGAVDFHYGLDHHPCAEASSTRGWNRGEVYAGARRVAGGPAFRVSLRNRFAVRAQSGGRGFTGQR